MIFDFLPAQADLPHKILLPHCRRLVFKYSEAPTVTIAITLTDLRMILIYRFSSRNDDTSDISQMRIKSAGIDPGHNRRPLLIVSGTYLTQSLPDTESVEAVAVTVGIGNDIIRKDRHYLHITPGQIYFQHIHITWNIIPRICCIYNAFCEFHAGFRSPLIILIRKHIRRLGTGGHIKHNGGKSRRHKRYSTHQKRLLSIYASLCPAFRI